MTDHIPPNEGGCWYCSTAGPTDLVFCREFDTYVHLSCAKRAADAKPDDGEAQIIWDEVGPKLKEQP